HDVQLAQRWIRNHEHGRDDGEILGHVVGDRERRQRAARDQKLLPMATISMSLVGLLSRSTMLPASLAALVPEFMATPTSACARAGASLVPSPVMATSRPWA